MLYLCSEFEKNAPNVLFHAFGRIYTMERIGKADAKYELIKYIHICK